MSDDERYEPVPLGFGIEAPPPSYKAAISKKNETIFKVRREREGRSEGERGGKRAGGGEMNVWGNSKKNLISILFVSVYMSFVETR